VSAIDAPFRRALPSVCGLAVLLAAGSRPPAAALTAPPAADVAFVHLSLEQGLSQASVYCILQDRLGYLWFGTQDGLNRYGGYGFEVYRPRADEPNSLSHHFIRALYEDAQGDIWVGTDGGGLDRLERQTGRIVAYRHDPADPHSPRVGAFPGRAESEG
jgi:ligand-binding sensor domain-containing protein